ncbi:peptidoglycan DD-metalloendopeptidase family protein [Streptomyces sp. x-80]|uniref:M23 family metallopeptidase n=1 Tax=Streptomyces sp. x-80 TaxID=2789282 RepID=UPI0039807CFA
MNDRPPPGAPLPTGSTSDASYAQYPAYDSYGQQPATHGHAEYGNGDPLFGSFDGTGRNGTGAYDTAHYGTGGTDPMGTTGAYPGTAYDTGAYGTGAYATNGYAGGGYATTTYDTGGQPGAAGHGSYDPYAHTAYGTPAYDSAPYDTGGWQTTGHPTDGYSGDAYSSGSYPTGPYDTAGYGTTGAYGTGNYAAPDHHAPGHDHGTGGYPAAAAMESGSAAGSYEATAVWAVVDRDLIPGIPAQPGPSPDDTVLWDTTTWDEPGPYGTGRYAADQFETVTHETVSPRSTGRPAASPQPAGQPREGHEPGADDEFRSPAAAPDLPDAADVADAMTQAMPIAIAVPGPGGTPTAAPDTDKAARGRGRRRTVKRSALLTVAVPSVAALGVCAVAAASVSGLGGDDKDDKGGRSGTTTQAAADLASVKAAAANSKLDTQLAGLSHGADDFADRASRTQERIDLKARQVAEKKRKQEEAARKEAARPKFALPVAQHGLSALFGQAGVNWMSVHTGIDFPVGMGTPVMAATDGTVRTQQNSAYGNMAIVTAPDGTETWYCHLSSTKIRSGSVKAGDTIAYSGKSGNSTGPHMHFEVRPGGDSPIDPLPWLRNHGLNPN